MRHPVAMTQFQDKEKYRLRRLKKRIISNSLKPGEPLNEGFFKGDENQQDTGAEALQQLERDGFVENVRERAVSFQGSLSRMSRSCSKP